MRLTIAHLSAFLLVNVEALPAALGLIFTDALTGTAAVDGFAGSAIIIAIQFGVARGIFSNESGTGSAAIAAAAAPHRRDTRCARVWCR